MTQDTPRVNAMRANINAAIAKILGLDSPVIDYYQTTKDRMQQDHDDGSFDALLEFYVEACMDVATTLSDPDQLISGVSVSDHLVKTFQREGVDSYLIEYYGK